MSSPLSQCFPVIPVAQPTFVAWVHMSNQLNSVQPNNGVGPNSISSENCLIGWARTPAHFWPVCNILPRGEHMFLLEIYWTTMWANHHFFSLVKNKPQLPPPTIWLPSTWQTCDWGYLRSTNFSQPVYRPQTYKTSDTADFRLIQLRSTNSRQVAEMPGNAKTQEQQ